jgi:hypothetical protein
LTSNGRRQYAAAAKVPERPMALEEHGQVCLASRCSCAASPPPPFDKWPRFHEVMSRHRRRLLCGRSDTAQRPARPTVENVRPAWDAGERCTRRISLGCSIRELGRWLARDKPEDIRRTTCGRYGHPCARGRDTNSPSPARARRFPGRAGSWSVSSPLQEHP